MSNPIQTEKERLRREAIARRDALPPEARQAAAEAIAARQFPLAIATGMIVSGFMPLKSEINPLPLMRKLAAQGARLALPAVAGRGKPLVMREWVLGEPLDAGVWGIREPKPEAAEVEPDILLVPLARLRPRRPSHRLRRRLLRSDACATARAQARYRGRARIRRPGSCRRARHAARRAARSCANRA